MALWWRRTPPDPRLGMAVEVGGGNARGVGNVVGISDRYPSKGLAAEDPPSAFDEVEPGGTRGDEGMLETRVVR